jgi:acyl-CoA thioesterase
MSSSSPSSLLLPTLPQPIHLRTRQNFAILQQVQEEFIHTDRHSQPLSCLPPIPTADTHQFDEATVNRFWLKKSQNEQINFVPGW